MDQREILEKLNEFAVAALNGMGSLPMNVFLMSTAEGKCAMAPVGWANDQERTEALQVVRDAMVLAKIVRYGVVSEAWVAKYDDGQSRDVRPSQREDRSEVIMIVSVDPAAETPVLHRILPIERDADGKIVLGEAKNVQFDGLGGEMVSLLAA